MYIGRVSGTVVATIKNELFEGRKNAPSQQVDQQNRAGRKHQQRDDSKLELGRRGAGDFFDQPLVYMGLLSKACAQL